MTKNDLKTGMKITLRDGRKFLCIKDICYEDFLGLISLDENDTSYITLDHIKDDLTACNPQNDIVRVESLSLQNLDEFIKRLKKLFLKKPINLEWERAWERK